MTIENRRMKQYCAVLLSSVAICVFGDASDKYSGIAGKEQLPVTSGMFVLLPYHSDELKKLSMMPLHEVS